MNAEKNICFIIGITVVTVIGFLMIPPFMKKYSNKLYKASLKKEYIDFEKMGPEIVKKNDTEKG